MSFQHMLHDCQYLEAAMFLPTLGLCGAQTEPNPEGEIRDKCPDCLALQGAWVTCPNCGEEGQV